jgi:hypothetical protein
LKGIEPWSLGVVRWHSHLQVTSLTSTDSHIDWLVRFYGSLQHWRSYGANTLTLFIWNCFKFSQWPQFWSDCSRGKPQTPLTPDRIVGHCSPHLYWLRMTFDVVESHKTSITDLVLSRFIRDFNIATSIGCAIGKTDGWSNMIGSVSHVCSDAYDVTIRILDRVNIANNPRFPKPFKFTIMLFS